MYCMNKASYCQSEGQTQDLPYGMRVGSEKGGYGKHHPPLDWINTAV